MAIINPLTITPATVADWPTRSRKNIKKKWKRNDMD